MLTGQSLIQIAYRWFENGVIPIPLHFKTKHPAIRWADYQHEKPEWREVVEWFDTRFYRNLALIVGPISGNLVVLDFDRPLEYFKWRDRCEYVSYTVRTGRGYHVYARLADCPGSTLAMEGGEIKARGYVAAPPSVHSNGTQYRAVDPTQGILIARDLRDLAIEPKLPREKKLLPATSRQPGFSVIAEIKARLPITVLLSEYTVLEPSGGEWFMCRCPLHDDRNPSMWVNAETGHCRCFKPNCPGHGRRSMDVINLYSRLTGIQNGESIKELARRLEIA